ncbi:hypothetical protein V498_05389 [Pseudogymnoascus sp. VKM F-4517 (FW-2822)]|nr:hypothetical protein V498_05389 [Pseudogymnoascus sp. VKM F-4517 (FW-2822)]
MPGVPPNAIANLKAKCKSFFRSKTSKSTEAKPAAAAAAPAAAVAATATPRPPPWPLLQLIPVCGSKPVERSWRYLGEVGIYKSRGEIPI